MTERYICIHGHFYQPPRENPWLERIELQDTAYPYHDWNERITAECYAPNTAARTLDPQGRISHIINNYAKISFNIGPTLMAWLEAESPTVYRAILKADRQSLQNFSGHGSAMAQAYNHMIMPLANKRDKHTQVLWGIRDFKHRFWRPPEGMWLPETAVDIETLEILSELGIRFTMLAPHQARRVRRIGSQEWQDASGDRIDPTMAYEARLPSGRVINVFFYDGHLSQALAFGNLLERGDQFARALAGGFSSGRTWPQLINVATDGETYGHHRRHGDMALAYALNYIEVNNLARLTNYGEFLEKNPATHEVEIFENTSWSCGHGVERWRSNCGCNTGGHPGWDQSWREPLREALDWLRDNLERCYEEHAPQFLKDPWAARDDYITVILDRSTPCVQRFFRRHALHELSETEQTSVLKLLELQRHAMLMYTSCGWFFDELSGIETVQVLQYAGRSIQIGQELFGDSLEERFLQLLARARSNLPEYGDGRAIYERLVKPAVVDLEKVAAHYVVSSLFQEYPEQARVYCYQVKREDYHRHQTGALQLATGRIGVTCEITRESLDLSFGVLHFGDHNVAAGVQPDGADEGYRALVRDLTEPFLASDLPRSIRMLDRNFKVIYSLRSLFRDEQRRILNLILDTSLADAEAMYRQVYEHHAPLMRFLTELGMPLPGAFHSAATLALNSSLRRAFAEDTPVPERILPLLEEARAWKIDLDTGGLSYTLEQSLERLARYFRAQPGELPLLERLHAVVEMATSLPFELDLWQTQNSYYEMLQTIYPDFKARAEHGDEAARLWTDRFRALGERLVIRVE
ncbi:MAG: DUF3536 domain-containing protein [Chloroflexi bacterium]|nr:DUF3536 domain-containing protein [Chloroflexota bacterium]